MNKAALTLLVVTLLLVTIGIVMLFSVSSLSARDKYGDPNYLLKRQLLWMGIGGVAGMALAVTPYQKYRVWTGPALLVAVVLLGLVLIPQIGVKVSGARRWLNLGAMRLQPSEFAKLALIAWLAHYLAKEKRRMERWDRGFAIPAAVAGLVCGLILVEPDFGTTALLGAVTMLMLFVGGARLRFLVPSLLAAGGAFALLILNNPVRLQRMLAFTDLEKYKAGAGYQVWQAMLAFGSGGLNGLGLGNSRQKMFYLPEAHTDFIAPIIGEELGLIGSLVVLGCFATLIGCGVLISLRTPDLFGQYLGLGICFLIGLQTLINLGVVTAWLPTKGLALPFISYGGSNVLMNLAAVGMLLSVGRYGAARAEGPVQEFFAEREPVS